MKKTIKNFPNGFTSWAETHYEIVQSITIDYSKDEPASEIIKDVQEKYGHGGLYELSVELTDKFENLHKDTEFGVDLEFFDTIQEFITKELFGEI